VHAAVRVEERQEAARLQLIRKVYEIDPLLCTFCGAAMRIVAFIVDRSSVRRLLQPPARSRDRTAVAGVCALRPSLLYSRVSDTYTQLRRAAKSFGR
jgi:hypothetical protein